METPFNGVDIYQNNVYVGSHGCSNRTVTCGPKPNDIFNKLRDFRAKIRKNLIVSYLNINSIRNKFESLKTVVCNNLDIITIAETKLDSTFTTRQFMIDGFIKPFRYDRNKNGEGLLTFVRTRVPARELKAYKFPSEIEIIVLELIIKKVRWLLLNLYRPPNQCSKFFYNEVEKGLDFYRSKYEKFILIGDQNCEPSNSVIQDFMDSYNFTNMVRDPTCFTSSSPACIDLILTNGKGSLISTITAETGLSDFHVMILTAIRGGFVKRGPRIKIYRDYKSYKPDIFIHDILANLLPRLPQRFDYSSFEELINSILEKHIPIKKKYVRAIDGAFMNKELRKAIMHRSKLRNRYNKNKTVEKFQCIQNTKKPMCKYSQED